MERYRLFTWPICVLLFGGWIQNAGAAETVRVSVSTAGVEADAASELAVISGNGRYVAFESKAENLAPELDGFISGNTHVFLRDLATNTTIVVDSSAAGLSDSSSFAPAISSDGRFIAFSSGATNLGPLNIVAAHVFVRDAQTGTFFIASVNDSGELADGGQPAISETGRFIAFTSFAQNLASDNNDNFEGDVYLRDTQSGTTERVSIDSNGVQGDRGSNRASVSSDGRFVVFVSQATNLVSGDTNNAEDIFLRDRVAGTTIRISVGPSGEERNGSSNLAFRPKISADGRFVVYDADDDNLVAIDTNLNFDIFVYDIAAGTNSLGSLTNSGEQFDLSVASKAPSISKDGRYLAFSNFTGRYIRDREAGSTTLILTNVSGGAAVSISDSGQLLAFSSNGALVANDTNGVRDIFVLDQQTAPPSTVSVVASVLPTSRSVQVGGTASAFATIITTGSGDGVACAPGLPPGTAIPFSFQATDAATNAPIGTADTPVDIAEGQAQSFVFSLNPTVALAPISLALEFSCANSDSATSIAGVNTFLFSASDQPVGDVIVLSATLGAIPGVVDLDGVSGAGAFAIATFNVGAADTFTVAPRPSNGLAVTLSICQTNPADGTCMQPPSTEVVTAIANAETPTFAVFASGTGVDVPLDPASSRVFVDFTDSGDAIRGGSSVAVRTN